MRLRVLLMGMAICAGLRAHGTPRAGAEVRGTWVTTTANDAVASPAKSAQTMRTLREVGLNTVYVECWKNGYTEFPSPTLKRFIGIDHKINLPEQPPGRDLLAETLIEAHRNQLIYIAWFEYGFMAANADTHNELRARKDWLVLNRQGGEVAKNGFVWLNPLHPDAQTLLIGIVTDAIRQYDLDGIQLDDRIVWPSLEMGYDAFTRKLYSAEHAGQEPPADIRDAEWVRWRKAKVEKFAKRFVREVRTAGGKDLIVSLSPGPHPWALENYLIDWPAWSRWTEGPTWDEFVPQVYRMDYATFAKDLGEQVEFIGARNKDLVAGIRLTGDGPDLSGEDTIKSVQACRRLRIAGHCWWFSRAVLDVHREPLMSFYQGWTPHPAKGAQWRPAPIVARREAGEWKAAVPKGARYRVIVKNQQTWQALGTVIGDGNEQSVSALAGAKEVELLQDRRGGGD